MRRCLIVAFAVIAAACTTAGADDTPTTRAADVAMTTSTLPAPPSIAPTVPATADTAPPPPTTAPATPPLDRGDSATLERMAADLAVALDIGPHPAGGDADREWSEYIEAQLVDLGLDVSEEEVALPTGHTTRNLWVTLGPVGAPHVLLGGHHDSVEVSPGVDDNGSGVVVLLELARRYTEAPPEASVTIAFFGGEEVPTGYEPSDHHYGSRLMAARLADAGELPDLMVSADMIGVGDRLLGVTYMEGADDAARLLAQSAEQAGVPIDVISRGDISDHEAFARAGVPSVFMWRPDNPAWHTAEDDHYEPALLLEDLAVLERFVALAPEWLRNAD